MKKAVFALLFIALVAFGVWQYRDVLFPPSGESAAGDGETPGEGKPIAEAEGLAETLTEVARLPDAALYQMKDGVLDLELSEYAGYAGLIVANGGLEPSENSYFFKNHGFKVRITLSEEESWPALNTGRIGASATTVDVLAVYAKTFQAVVPAQIGFSRGADAVVVLSEIKRVNQLKGRVLIATQFTEADFFIRYLASEAGLEVRPIAAGERPDPERVNLIYATDSFVAGELFAASATSSEPELAGAVVWGSAISEVLEAAGGKARKLVDNRNLLVVADVLVVNKPFAAENPKVVEGLVDGLLAGNDMVRTNPDAHLDVVARAFKWTREDAKTELASVHFSNLPENQAFFSGAIDAAGSYGGIYQSAMLAYGSILNHSVPRERLLDLKLDALAARYAHQKVSIQPIRSARTGSVEDNPLLSRDIRFYFAPNVALLEAAPENDKNYESIRQLLQVAPGSKVLLRGHVDNGRVEEFKRNGPEFFRARTLEAMSLSEQRAGAVRTELAKRFEIPAERIEIVGRGWEEPVATDGDLNRRVEVQWFTLE
jgi:NitT/TauT family transport system substrate-binding protein